MDEIEHQDYSHPVTKAPLSGAIPTLGLARLRDKVLKKALSPTLTCADLRKYSRQYVRLCRQIRLAGVVNYELFVRAYVLACLRFRAVVRRLIGEDKIKAWWKRVRVLKSPPPLPKGPKLPKPVRVPKMPVLNWPAFGLVYVARPDLGPKRITIEPPVSFGFGFKNPTPIIRFTPDDLDPEGLVSNTPILREDTHAPSTTGRSAKPLAKPVNTPHQEENCPNTGHNLVCTDWQTVEPP